MNLNIKDIFIIFKKLNILSYRLNLKEEYIYVLIKNLFIDKFLIKNTRIIIL